MSSLAGTLPGKGTKNETVSIARKIVDSDRNGGSACLGSSKTVCEGGHVHGACPILYGAF